MLHQKIDLLAAVSLDEVSRTGEDRSAHSSRSARLWTGLVIVALPLMLLWLLARLIWNDVKAAGRAASIFYGGVAEELARRP